MNLEALVEDREERVDAAITAYRALEAETGAFLRHLIRWLEDPASEITWADRVIVANRARALAGEEMTDSLSALIAQVQEEPEWATAEELVLAAALKDALETMEKIAVAGYVKTGTSADETSFSGDPRLEGLADMAHSFLERHKEETE